MSDRPLLVGTRAELAEALRERPGRVGLVPTMGALHAGHASLMTRARSEVDAGPVVVSVFVNPLQFGAGEDLDRYPRTLAADLALCGDAGVDVVFAPTVAEVYPGGDPQVTVGPGPLGEVLEGRTRPGHFRGVLTVVAKLFGLVRPDVAVFGEKDFQQLALIRRMAADLCLGVDVVGAPTLRDPDGLAMSSRNAYLSAQERQHALALSRALRAAERAAAETGSVAAARAAAEAVLADAAARGEIELDYLALTTPDLEPLSDDPSAAVLDPGTPARALLAARVGTTRLIDNIPLRIGRIS
ncbi:pantoate--beta-alanine ligase [Nocardioides sp.]|uniref:pantoate--beta-alanine ligase n=1 Tax=Nocardioides sp. TaxID=35761 RepID=UPI0035124089